MAQLSYSINMPAFTFPGQVADMGNLDKLTAMAYLSPMPYGVLAVRDNTNTSDFAHISCKLPASAGDVTTLGKALGVTVADQARAQDPSVAAAQYPQYSAVPVMKKGRIVVLTEGAVTAGAPCFVRYSSTVNGSQTGAFRGDADTISSADHAAALPGAYYESTLAAAGFAVVELTLV